MAWTRVASAAELEDKSVLGVECAGQAVALYWVDGAPFATSDICTHAQAHLSEGFLDGDCIECPVHQALFNVRTGAAVAGPATEPVRAYPCRIDGDDISIDI